MSQQKENKVQPANHHEAVTLVILMIGNLLVYLLVLISILVWVESSERTQFPPSPQPIACRMVWKRKLQNASHLRFMSAGPTSEGHRGQKICAFLTFRSPKYMFKHRFSANSDPHYLQVSDRPTIEMLQDLRISDARLMQWKDKIIVMYNQITPLEYRESANKRSGIGVMVLQLEPAHRQGWITCSQVYLKYGHNVNEKNWSMWTSVQEQSLFCSYTLNPHQVLRIDPFTGDVDEVVQTSAAAVFRKALHTDLFLACSTPAIHLPEQNLYLAFGHARTLTSVSRSYGVFAYVFHDRFPYAVCGCSSWLEILPWRYRDKLALFRDSIVFPMSLQKVSQNKIEMCIGFANIQSFLIQFHLPQILSLLRWQEQPGTETVLQKKKNSEQSPHLESN